MSRISAHPSYVVEVTGIDPESPVSLIETLMRGSTDSSTDGVDKSAESRAGSSADGSHVPVKFLIMDRTAIVKFKRHSDVSGSLFL